MHDMAAFSQLSPRFLLRRQRGIATLLQKRQLHQRVADESVGKLQTPVGLPSTALPIAHLAAYRNKRLLLILRHQRQLLFRTQLLHALHAHVAASLHAEPHEQRIARLPLTQTPFLTSRPTLSLEKMCTYSMFARKRRSRRPLAERAWKSPPLPLGDRAIWGIREWQKYAVFFSHQTGTFVVNAGKGALRKEGDLVFSEAVEIVRTKSALDMLAIEFVCHDEKRDVDF